MNNRPSVHVIRRSDHKIRPWKNGGGETVELAIAPVGATIDTFDWRLSIARIAAPGPFSPFSGYDRTLVLLEGAGVRLTDEGGVTTDITPAQPMISFAGEQQLHGAPLDGPSSDFNVMTRRGRFAHHVAWIKNRQNDVSIPANATIAILCVKGTLTVTLNGKKTALAQHDLLVVPANCGHTGFFVMARGHGLIVTLQPGAAVAPTEV